MIEWIQLLIHEKEPLALIIAEVDSFKFPGLPGLYKALKILASEDADPIIKEYLTHLEQFNSDLDRGWLGILGMGVGCVVGLMAAPASLAGASLVLAGTMIGNAVGNNLEESIGLEGKGKKRST